MKKGCAMLQSTIQLPFYVCDWCTKESRKTESFQVSYSCFYGEHDGKNRNTWQSNVPFIMETGLELLSKQPESFHAKGERNSNKKETKRTFLSEFLTMKATNTLKIFTQETAIKCTSCPGNADSFSKRISSSYKKGREKRQHKDEKYVRIMIYYWNALTWPSWWFLCVQIDYRKLCHSFFTFVHQFFM